MTAAQCTQQLIKTLTERSSVDLNIIHIESKRRVSFESQWDEHPFTTMRLTGHYAFSFSYLLNDVQNRIKLLWYINLTAKSRKNIICYGDHNLSKK